MATYGQMLERAGVTIPPHLQAQVEIPVISDAPQAQGDVFIVPAAMYSMPKGMKFGEPVTVPAQGTSVVEAESAGANRHDLFAAEGTVTVERCTTGSDENPVIMMVTVSDGSIATITHSDEHGCNSMGAGTYVITGKREWAENTTRRVAD